MRNHVLLVQCSDEVGLISKISRILYELKLNIIEMKEHVDQESEVFYMRCEFEGEADAERIKHLLEPELPQEARVSVNPKVKKDIIIFATKEHHCLSDILIRHYFGELNAHIKCVVSNHETLREIVEKFGIEFRYVSHLDKSKEKFEDECLEAIKDMPVDYLVLAKFMRILSPDFVKQFPSQIINIHHSFLPAFIGANPYKQAFDRGIKLIGATAHFVTNQLDEGPIITQQTIKVDHSYSADDMKVSGREIERFVLAQALKHVFDDRVFVTGNKTVVFE
jgi:formyltetrahydrofolate deformylase